MKDSVLILDPGSRGHAYAFALGQSRHVKEIHALDCGWAQKIGATIIPLDIMNFSALARYAAEKEISLTVVGPEDPLGEREGIVDVFHRHPSKPRIFGPSKAAMDWTENWKDNAKRLMEEEGIPTAPFKVFSEYGPAKVFVEEKGVPIVIKTVGRCQGKGSRICRTPEQAEKALRDFLIERIFGPACRAAVIEDYLGPEGEEVTIHAFCNGLDAELFPFSQDHKYREAAEDSPREEIVMTGGMGVITPVPWLSQTILGIAESTIVTPAIRALYARNCRFKGIFYPGCMAVRDTRGKMVIKALEINGRGGSPEMEAHVRQIAESSDWYEVMQACAGGERIPRLGWREGYSVCVIAAAEHYPFGASNGKRILGLEEAEKIPGVEIFYGPVKWIDDACYTQNAGRILAVTAIGNTLEKALGCAYQAVGHIQIEGENVQYRKDIGKNALAKMKG